ncbi:DUF3352 domain-containing protein [Candidatus Peregrinibacteria bacterium]|nr:MAG: DUF3352 domain-containing protein [Candidatus Peregrinibacteria bacterium]
MSHSRDALNYLINDSSAEGERLSSDPKYLELFSRLPRHVWIKTYFDFNQGTLNLPAPYDQLSVPLWQLLDRFGLTVRKQGAGLHFNSLLMNRADRLPFPDFISNDPPLLYRLTSAIPPDSVVAYLGGADLADEWQNTLTTLAHVNPAYGLIVEGLLRAQLQRLFGDDVDLRDDLYPLFQGEYALVFEQNTEAPLATKLILAHHDRPFIEAKMTKLLDGFRALSAQFAPELKIIDLSDEEQNREMVLDPNRMQESNEPVAGTPVSCVSVSESAYGFCYAITDDLLILSNQRYAVESSLLSNQSEDASLHASRPFRHIVSQLTTVSSEMSYLDLTRLNAALSESPYGPMVHNWLQGLSQVAWVKHYFKDGVSTEGVLTFF